MCVQAPDAQTQAPLVAWGKQKQALMCRAVWYTSVSGMDTLPVPWHVPACTTPLCARPFGMGQNLYAKVG